MENKDFFKPLNNGISQELFDAIIKSNLDCNFHMEMGIHVTELAPSFAEIKCIVSENHLNPRDIAHGALFFAILDTAMGMAVRTLGFNSVTIQCSSSFIKPAVKGEVLTGRARIESSGKNIYFASGELFDSKEILIASTVASFFNRGSFL